MTAHQAAAQWRRLASDEEVPVWGLDHETYTLVFPPRAIDQARVHIHFVTQLDPQEGPVHVSAEVELAGDDVFRDQVDMCVYRPDGVEEAGEYERRSHIAGEALKIAQRHFTYEMFDFLDDGRYNVGRVLMALRIACWNPSPQDGHTWKTTGAWRKDDHTWVLMEGTEFGFRVTLSGLVRLEERGPLVATEMIIKLYDNEPRFVSTEYRIVDSSLHIDLSKGKRKRIKRYWVEEVQYMPSDMFDETCRLQPSYQWIVEMIEQARVSF